MMPPVGAIIIGPCPQCNELVVVFCGHVLPLDKQIMESGALEERREHLLSVLMEFLQERIGKLMSDEAESSETEASGSEEEATAVSETSGNKAQEAGRSPSSNEDTAGRTGMSPISKSEMERFASIDLKLLDNKAYFKSVFEKN